MARTTGALPPRPASIVAVETPAAMEITSVLRPLAMTGPSTSAAFATSLGFTASRTMSAPAAASAASVPQRTPESENVRAAVAFERAAARRLPRRTLPDERSPERMLRPIVPVPITAIVFLDSMSPPSID